MNKIERPFLWAPRVLARGRIDERRWAYAVEAPFDMSPDMPGLIGMTVDLDGVEFEIRGFVPAMPPVPIKQGEMIELLVRSVNDASRIPSSRDTP
jgi:hypothetical protein